MSVEYEITTFSQDLLATISGNISVMNNGSSLVPEDEPQVRPRKSENLAVPVILGFICTLGILGNGLNFYLMLRGSLRRGFRRERGVYVGFVCLALSDILACLFILPRVFIRYKKALFDSYGFALVYQQYGDALVYVFVLCSTWITVQLAIGRCLVVCDPLRKRGAFCIKGRWTIGICLAILFASFLFSVPTFMLYECTPYVGKYLLMPRDMYILEVLRIHGWFRFFLGYAIPFFILLSCNICLVVTLKKSDRIRAGMQASSKGPTKMVGNRISPTLIGIILAYLVLMTPSEILDFIFDSLGYTPNKKDIYAILRSVANLMQTSNFAMNFALHLGINSVCRKALRDMMCSTCCRVVKSRRRLESLETKTSFRLSSLSPMNHGSIYVDTKNSACICRADMI